MHGAAHAKRRRVNRYGGAYAAQYGKNGGVVLIRRRGD
jgi:hypothetical protein